MTLHTGNTLHSAKHGPLTLPMYWRKGGRGDQLQDVPKSTSPVAQRMMGLLPIESINGENLFIFFNKLLDDLCMRYYTFGKIHVQNNDQPSWMLLII